MLSSIGKSDLIMRIGTFLVFILELSAILVDERMPIVVSGDGGGMGFL